MMQILWFTLTAAVLYLVADRLLDAAERLAGRRFEYRSLIFFVLLFGMATVTFALIRRYTG
ncbi:MAG: hypothetical protein QY320_05575 [Gammaproteobacteria bacterium]|nr:MAG: hypothetical protein QY320_05575 [Gammaproteobacteria bacterium]